MKFTKMHGCGNDYIYINGFTEQIPSPEYLSVQLSNRHFGIGADGLIIIGPSTVADFSMRMYNADGSEGAMCGNGVRCIAKYVYEYGLTNKTNLSLETKSGIKLLDLHIKDGLVDTVTVDMGIPALNTQMLPVNTTKETLIHEPIQLSNQLYPMTCVSIGNPHAVLFTDDVLNLDFDTLAPTLAPHPLFPEGVNWEFVQLQSPTELTMRVFERGSGETLACGTGACASVFASIVNQYTNDTVLVHLKGGDLQIHFNHETNHIFMTGPARIVYDGEIDLSTFY